MENEEEVKGSVEISKLRQSNRDKDELINTLKKKLISFEDEKLSLLEDRGKLAKLYDLGLIDSAGEPLYVETPDLEDKDEKEEIMRF